MRPYLTADDALPAGSADPGLDATSLAHEFFDLSRDGVLERRAAGTRHFEVLQPSGRWAPIPDSFEDHLQRRVVTEPEAQELADRYTGQSVDLHAAALPMADPGA